MRAFASFRQISRTKALKILFTACAIAFFFSAAVGQSRNTISGFVFTQERTPISNVPVEIMNEVYQVLSRTRTDGSGRYFFAGLSSGRFVVRVLPYGTNFEEQSQEVEIINFPRPGGSTSDMAYKDFYLRLRKSGPSVRTMSGTVYAQEVPANAKKLYEKGVSEMENDNTEAATQSLLEALRSFPDYYAALELLGRIYVEKQNYLHARAVFIKAVSVNERSYAGWYGLAYSAYALKEHSIAVEAATRATVLQQDSVQAFLILGISQRSAKDFGKAETALLQAKKLANGQSADVHWNLALLYGNNMNKFREAADELELYLKIAPAGTKTEDVKKLVTRFREKAAGKT